MTILVWFKKESIKYSWLQRLKYWVCLSFTCLWLNCLIANLTWSDCLVMIWTEPFAPDPNNLPISPYLFLISSDSNTVLVFVVIFLDFSFSLFWIVRMCDFCVSSFNRFVKWRIWRRTKWSRFTLRFIYNRRFEEPFQLIRSRCIGVQMKCRSQRIVIWFRMIRWWSCWRIVD